MLIVNKVHQYLIIADLEYLNGEWTSIVQTFQLSVHTLSLISIKLVFQAVIIVISLLALIEFYIIFMMTVISSITHHIFSHTYSGPYITNIELICTCQEKLPALVDAILLLCRCKLQCAVSSFACSECINSKICYAKSIHKV